MHKLTTSPSTDTGRAASSVSVRVRPLNDAETERGSAWKIDSNKILPVVGAVREDSNFVLDSVFDGSSTTEQVFEQTTEDLIAKIVEGFNGTVFAYGQTSSGKTHTMRGSATAPGIIPLSIQRVFSHIEAAQDREFLLRVSYIEVWPGAHVGRQ